MHMSTGCLPLFLVLREGRIIPNDLNKGIWKVGDIDMIQNTMSPYPVDEPPTVTSFPSTTAGENWKELMTKDREKDNIENNIDNNDATNNGSKESRFLDRILDTVNGWLDIFTVDVTHEMRSLPDDIEIAARKAVEKIKKISRSKRNSKIKIGGKVMNI